VYEHICSGGGVLCDKLFCDPLTTGCVFRLRTFVLLLALTICKGCWNGRCFMQLVTDSICECVCNYKYAILTILLAINLFGNTIAVCWIKLTHCHFFHGQHCISDTISCNPFIWGWCVPRCAPLTQITRLDISVKLISTYLNDCYKSRCIFQQPS